MHLTTKPKNHYKVGPLARQLIMKNLESPSVTSYQTQKYTTHSFIINCFFIITILTLSPLKTNGYVNYQKCISTAGSLDIALPPLGGERHIQNFFKVDLTKCNT
jgi:hypothetical protein